MSRNVAQRLDWRRIARDNRAFLVLLGLAFLLRVVTTLLYHPGALQANDILRYTRARPTGFFADPYSPAGYTAFLRAIFFFSPNLSVTIVVQHLLGLVSGTFVYLMVKRVSGIAWLGLIPAALVMFSGDYLFLESTLLSETLFTTLLIMAMWAALHALDDEHPSRWLAASSLLMMMSALVRPITLELPLVLAAWAAIALGGTLRERTTGVLASIVPAGLLVAAYLAIASAIGPYSGINEMTGWNLYSRVGPFADCSRFTPPEGTQMLCESKPKDQRYGPFYYSWVKESPGRANFRLGPKASGKLEEFARAAILGQPLSYLKAVTKDMVRYIDPEVGHSLGYDGIPYIFDHFDFKEPGQEELVGALLEKKGYTGVLPTQLGGSELLQDYQDVFHLSGLPVLVLAILAMVGIVIDRGRRRAAIVLLSVVAFLLYLLPVLTLSYDVRYGWPPAPLLTAAAVLSCLGIYQRFFSKSASPHSGGLDTDGELRERERRDSNPRPPA
jgi:hypothetical protein